MTHSDSIMTHSDSIAVSGLVIRWNCFGGIVMDQRNGMEMPFVAHEVAWTRLRSARGQHATKNKPQREEQCCQARNEGEQRVHAKTNALAREGRQVTF